VLRIGDEVRERGLSENGGEADNFVNFVEDWMHVNGLVSKGGF
jgi:hypothetical protein